MSSLVSPRAFRRVSVLSGTVILTVIVLLRFFSSYNDMDFGQFYMGGLIARTGHWEALYPTPVPGSPYNVGENEASVVHPTYAALAEQYQVGDTKRFMQPPPNALFYFPFALLNYRTAHLMWTLMSVACASAIAFQAAKIYEQLCGRATYAAGILAFLIATSPTMYQSVRMGQVSTLMGCLIGVTLLGLLRPQQREDALCIVVATLTKYAAAILVPVHIAMRRWHTLMRMCIFVGVITLGSILIMGVDPWRIWVTQVVPTLGRTHDWAANQSVDGLLIKITGKFPLTESAQITVRVASIAALLPLLTFIFTRKREFWCAASNILATCAALLCWLQFFSPIFWTNYYPYLFPLWGWLAWEAFIARRSAIASAAALVAIALAWFPFSVLTPHLPLPLAFHIFLSSLVVLAFALTRMARPMQSAACLAAAESSK